MEAQTEQKTRTYGNWRKPRSSGLLGLGTTGTFALLVSLIVVIVVVMMRGIIWGLVCLVVLGIAIGLLAVRDSHDVRLLERIVTPLAFKRNKKAGTTSYRSGVVGRSQWGTHQLPGLAAPTRLSEFVDSHGKAFALLECPGNRWAAGSMSSASSA